MITLDMKRNVYWCSFVLLYCILFHIILETFYLIIFYHKPSDEWCSLEGEATLDDPTECGTLSPPILFMLSATRVEYFSVWSTIKLKCWSNAFLRFSSSRVCCLNSTIWNNTAHKKIWMKLETLKNYSLLLII